MERKDTLTSKLWKMCVGGGSSILLLLLSLDYPYKAYQEMVFCSSDSLHSLF